MRQSDVRDGGPPEWFPLVYEELRSLAERWIHDQPGEVVLQPTALVHEVYIRMAERCPDLQLPRSETIALTVTAMRQVLVDHARRRNAKKRGGDRHRVTLESAAIREDHDRIDLLALDEALRRLADLHERQCRIVELRFMAGMSVEEVAMLLDCSPRTVRLDWNMARAWLRKELSEEAAR